MMWLWTGEVSADGQGYRVLATGQKGVMRPLAGIAKNFPAIMHLRVYGMNANGKVYAIDRAFGLEPVMPLILAVDTTSEYGSLALLAGWRTAGGSAAARARQLQPRALRRVAARCWSGTP